MNRNIRLVLPAVTMIFLLSFESASAQLFNGLVGYWDFNEGSGLIAHDRSSRGNDATLIQGASWTSAGRYEGALSLGGGLDAAQVLAPLSLPIGNSPRTIAGWMYVQGETGAYQALAGYGRPLAGNALPFVLERGASTWGPRVFELDWAINLAGDTPNGIPLNTWTHVATTFDGSTLAVYLNGALDGARPNAALATTLTEHGLLLGNAPPNDGWHGGLWGFIDDVAIWDRALNAGEISSIASNPVAVPEPGGAAALVLLVSSFSAAWLARRKS